MTTMADTIDLAINKYLWDGSSEWTNPTKDEFSCAAISRERRDYDRL